MTYKYSYGGALIGQEEKDAMKRIIDKNWWPLSEEGEKMEEEASAYLGVKHGVLANSGSSAGLLALSALELPKGSEIIIPAVTFPTIFNIIVQQGFVPVVVDSQNQTYNIDVDKLESAISGKTSAIICVHAVGNPVDMPRIMEIARKYRLRVIEDVCDGWGGDIEGKKLGSFGDISFTSFHAAHIVSMGQGGGVFTNDDMLAKNARMYRDWGRQAKTNRRANDGMWPALPADYDPRFIYEKIGYNLSPLELQAAMGRVQLKKTEDIKRKRRENFDFLCEKLSVYEDLLLPKVVEGANPSWFALPLTTRGMRAPLVAHLEQNGIETRSMFTGVVTDHPAYRGVEYREGTTLEGARNILNKSFWIGVHPRYGEEDMNWVAGVFGDYYALSS